MRLHSWNGDQRHKEVTTKRKFKQASVYEEIFLEEQLKRPSLYKLKLNSLIHMLGSILYEFLDFNTSQYFETNNSQLKFLAHLSRVVLM